MNGREFSLRTKLTLLSGIILLVSNAVLVVLLYVNNLVALEGFVLEMEGAEYMMHANDGFEGKLLFCGLLSGLLMTSVGTLIVYEILGIYLSPLRKLSEHMLKSDRENIMEDVSMKATTSEMTDLIYAFNSMTAKLRRMFDYQRDMSAYIAHEFRTPIAVAQAKIELFIMKGKDAKPEAIREISGQLKKLDSLVSGILEISNVNRASLKDVISAEVLVEDVFDNLAEMAERKSIKLEYECRKFSGEQHKCSDVLIKGNYDLLYHAFYNLVENGIKYTGEGGRVKLLFRECTHKLEILVFDTGEGISSGAGENIFDLFYRIENESPSKGSGIGLALVKRIIEHHGGTIRLCADSGNCSRFIITLDRFSR